MTDIYEKTKIIYDEKTKEFAVMDISNIQMWETIGTSETLNTACAIRSAYCRGVINGYCVKEKELRKEN